MADLILFTNPHSRGRIARWMLEEVGEPYEAKIIPYERMKDADYLAVNPMGKVPALRHDGRTITECAAICAYLADVFPKSALGPTVEEKADYYRWFFFAAGPVEQAISNHAAGWDPAEDKRRMFGYGTYDTVVDLLDELLGQRDYACGKRFTAVDVYLGSHVMWGIQFGTLPRRDAFVAYAERLGKREALHRASAKDEQAQSQIETAAEPQTA